MRIAVCHPHAPFMTGGAEQHTRGLVEALREAGHEVEIVTMPFKWYPPGELVHQMGMWRSLDLTESNGVRIDTVIALKFPAYLVRHPNKVVWLIHQHRTAYDLWDHPTADISTHPDGEMVREMIVKADRVALGEARWIFTNAENVRGRLERSLGIPGEALYHRSPLAQRLIDSEPGEPGDYILLPSRFDRLKRQSLAVEAMGLVESDVRLILVGAGPEEAALRDQIDRLGLGARVQIRVSVPEDELLDLYLGALSVFYGPFDEDYGLITVEGMGAARPVITTKDSGGPLELIDDEETGLVVEPEPASIAAAFDRLAADPRLSRRLGTAARELALVRIPDWPTIVQRLLA